MSKQQKHPRAMIDAWQRVCPENSRLLERDTVVRLVPESDYRRLRKIEREFEALLEGRHAEYKLETYE